MEGKGGRDYPRGGGGGRGQLTSNTVGLISLKKSGSFGKALIAIAPQIKKSACPPLCTRIHIVYHDLPQEPRGRPDQVTI